MVFVDLVEEVQRAIITDSGKKYYCPHGHSYNRTNNRNIHSKVPLNHRKRPEHEEESSWYYCPSCNDFYKIGQGNEKNHNNNGPIPSQKDKPPSLLVKIFQSSISTLSSAFSYIGLRERISE
mgnify:CR=1 FL=1